MTPLVMTCVGDLHFRIRNGIPRDWQVLRYHTVIQAIVKRCSSKGTPLVLLGDQLDDIQLRPDELKLFLLLLSELELAGVEVFLVSGNHETIKTGESIIDYLLVNRLFSNIHYRDIVMLYHQLPDGTQVNIHLRNHDSLENTAGVGIPPDDFNLLCTHVRCDINQFITAEADLVELVTGFDACVAGDIHSDVSSPEGIVYTNNPINLEFEHEPKTGFLEITIRGKGDYSINRIATDFAKLIRIDCAASEWAEAKATVEANPTHFYSVRMTGTPDELRSLDGKPDNCKIEKKPTTSVVRVADASMKDLDSSDPAEWAEAASGYLTAVDVADARKADLLKYDKDHL